jgi:hypothetical protein
VSSVSSKDTAFSANALTPTDALTLLQANLAHPAHRFWADEVSLIDSLEPLRPKASGSSTGDRRVFVGTGDTQKGETRNVGPRRPDAVTREEPGTRLRGPDLTSVAARISPLQAGGAPFLWPSLDLYRTCVVGAGDGNRTHCRFSFHQPNHADSAALTPLTHPDFGSLAPQGFAPKLRPTIPIEELSGWPPVR